MADPRAATRRRQQFASLALLVALALLSLAGCKPGVPRHLIQPGKMEKILYDYHIADGMAMADGPYEQANYRRTVYREAALRKHGVTQEEFDSAMVYYYRHTEELHDIYTRLAKRLNDEAVALGSTANEMSQLGGLVAQGDTATVWTYPESVTLMPMAPYNVLSFSVKADSSYHKGDRMILSLDTQFIFQEGMRDGVALLSVTFSNDSVTTRVQHMATNAHYVVQIQDDKMLGVKAVRGFVYLGRGQGNTSQTLKLMCVRNIRLLKMKEKVEKHDDETDDEAEATSAPDSTSNSADAAATTVAPPTATPPTHSVPLRPSVAETREAAPPPIR